MMLKGKKIIERLFYKNVALTRNLSEKGDITVDQLTAARALLNWSQADLAKKSGYSLPTINNIERGQYEAHSATMNDIIQTFEEAGIQFIDGPGVRIENSALRIKSYEGADALHYLFTKIILALEQTGGDLYISGIDEKILRKKAGEDLALLQKKLGKNVLVHILCQKAQSDSIVFQNYKKKVISDEIPLIPCFIYKERVAIVVLKNPIHVAILYNESLAKSHIAHFNLIHKISLLQERKAKIEAAGK
ncbi:MAG: helix-turn-helix transcriptional regulator, partial [Alphaproteobacteria bacterium]